MTDLHILVLSLIQGITEFLPISSSAHLIITSKFLGWADQGLSMDVAVHIGTLGAVVMYFASYVIKGSLGLFDIVRFKSTENSRFSMLIIVATIPVVIVGYLVKDFIEHELRSSNIIQVLAITSIVFGILLWLFDRIMPTYNRVEHLNYKHGIFLGIMQTIALIPGVSRSGICMTASRILGMERTESAKISMIMGMPTLLAAGVLVSIEAVKAGGTLFTQQALFAMLISFCAGLIAITSIMSWLRNSGMGVFAVYRIALGITLLNLF